MHLSEAWIETIADDAADRTSWTVRVSGKTLGAGSTRSDPSGLEAFEAARAWAHENAHGVAFMWSHRRDSAGGIGASLAEIDGTELGRIFDPPESSS